MGLAGGWAAGEASSYPKRMVPTASKKEGNFEKLQWETNADDSPNIDDEGKRLKKEITKDR